MMPGKVDPIDWPSVQLDGQTLIVKWSLYVQWLLSKRRVAVRDLGRMMHEKDPGLVDLMMECFAAAVAENYKAAGLQAPSADHWAQVISEAGEGTWSQVVAAVWGAVGKARPAASQPAQPQPAQTAAQLAN